MAGDTKVYVTKESSAEVVKSSIADDTDALPTQIFDPDAPYIQSDAVFGVKESLMAEFRPVDDKTAAKEHGFYGRIYDVDYDFVLARV